MRIAMISPVAWRTPPVHYGPWERFASLLTEGLVKKGVDVTLFATGDSLTGANLRAVIARGYEENKESDAKVCECLHISEVFEQAESFDLIHNNFDFLPLTFSRLVKTPVVTTIHGFSSPKIIPVYKKYNNVGYYVAISNSDKSPELKYAATIYHGIDVENFTFNAKPLDKYLIYFGRVHHDKGTKEAIEIARMSGYRLIMAGIIQDASYYRNFVEPAIDNENIIFLGSVGPEKRNEILGNASALLHPINFREPFGLAVVEAMACGTPVIAFNRGSMPEIITHEKDGFLVSSVDEAVDAVHSIGKINREECRKTVQNRFTADIMVDNYLKLYKKILS
ncbi:MAG: glycosyltransferase family 4 protein [Oligoflexia bacterium]|nr:glycosyltransferase family 4 protein [Oligoflexia bacterium]